MKLSKRVLSIGHSPIRRFYVYANEAIEKGKKVYFLNIGQPDIETPKVFYDAINKFSEKVLEYAPSPGIPSMVESIKNYYARYGMNYQTDEIVITNGGSEAIQFALTAIIDPGDEVIVVEPYYTNYSTFISVVDGVKVPITTVAEDGYSYANKELIEKAITPKTKAMVVTSPGNPTGNVLSQDDMRMIADLAKKHGFFIIADEVYREMVYDGREMSSMGHFEDVADNVIIIDSISKRFSACGARIGCLLTKNKELYSNIMKLCQGRLSVPTLDQVGAAALYDELSPTYFDDVKAEYEHRRNICYDELKKIDGVVCEKPAGAFYITAKLPVDNAEDFLVWLLTEFDVDGETVMFAPVEGFYVTSGLGKNEIRIAYVLNADDLKKAMNIIRLGIEQYNKK